MARNFELVEEDDDSFGEDDEVGLTPEGQELWNNIARQELPKPKTALITLKVNTYERELSVIKKEVKKMIQHSKNVVKDCNEIIEQYKTEKEYLAGDAKVAKTLHTRLIDRLTRLYNGVEVFDFEVKIQEDMPPPKKSVLYHNPKR